MLCCFLSNRRFAVKLNGEFLGMAGNNLCGANICAKDTFFEFIPASSRFLPSSFFLDYNFLKKSDFVCGENPFSSSAPENGHGCRLSEKSSGYGEISVINIGNGFLFFPEFKHSPQFYENGYSPFIVRTTQNGNKAFFFYTGGFFCFLESSGGGDYFKLCNDFPKQIIAEDYKDKFIIIEIKHDGYEKNEVFIFDLSEEDKPTLVLKRIYDEIFIGDEIVTVLKTPSVTKIEKRESFNLTAPEKSYKIFTRETPVDSVSDKLLPFSFLEELSLGAHFEDYLSPELKGQKDLVAEFLGKFDFFLPKLYKTDEETAILIENKKIRRLSISLSRRLITDLNFI